MLAGPPTGATDAAARKPQSGDRTTSTKQQLLLPHHEVNTTLFYPFFFFLVRKKSLFFKKNMALTCKTRQLHPVKIPTGLRATPCLLSDVELVGGQRVHERTHQVVCGEVKDEAEGDGDGEGGQGLLEHSKQQQGQTQTLQDSEMREIGDSTMAGGTVPKNCLS